MKTPENETEAASRELFAPILWVRGGKYKSRPICCRDMAAAFLPCTDNEGDGRLARCYDDTPTAIYVGCDLPPLRFCPWCGTKLETLSWADAKDIPSEGSE